MSTSYKVSPGIAQSIQFQLPPSSGYCDHQQQYTMSRAAGPSLFSAGGAFSAQCAVPFSAFQKRQLALILAVGVLLLTAQCTSAAITRKTTGDVHLRGCASSACTSYHVILKGTSVTFDCRKKGEVVGRDPWWLHTVYCWNAGNTCSYGYVSDNYVDCGGVIGCNLQVPC